MSVVTFLRNKPLMLLPPLAGTISGILFLQQGGFGAGHGKFDPLLMVFGFPGNLLSMGLPLPEWYFHSELVYVVLVPMLINTGLVWSVYLALEWRRSSRSKTRN